MTGSFIFMLLACENETAHEPDGPRIPEADPATLPSYSLSPWERAGVRVPRNPPKAQNRLILPKKPDCVSLAPIASANGANHAALIDRPDNASVYDQYKLSLRCEVAHSRKYRLIRL